MNEVPGASAYAGMRARALTIDLDGIAMQIVGLDDLIRMKQTTGRPSDIEDIKALTTVARREAHGAGPGESHHVRNPSNTHHLQPKKGDERLQKADLE